MADTLAVFLRSPGPLGLAFLLLPFLLSCGDDTTTGLDASGLEILLVQGDEQAAEPGAQLPVPLRVRVQYAVSERVAENVKVSWDLLDGVGAIIDPASSMTDSAGVASARLTLGSTLGQYSVRASVKGMTAPPVDFRAEAVLTPSLTAVPTVPVSAGDTIIIQGKNFGTYAHQNVVTFSQVRGRVLSVQPVELVVEVPPCLPAGTVTVRLRVGELTTSSLPLMVQGGSEPLVMDPGDDVVLEASQGFACVHLPSQAGARYLVVPHSTGTVGGGVYEFSLLGIVGSSPSPMPAFEDGAAASGDRRPRDRSVRLPRYPSYPPEQRHPLGAQERWDERVRSLEKEALSRTRLSSGNSPARGSREEAAPTPIPALGEKRQFKVLKRNGGFDKVTASVRLVKDHSLVYVDDEAPAGGFTADDLNQLAGEFEDPIHTTVVGAFGSESDLDSNERVIILLTPAVNRLTEPGSDGFIGGFFFGLDLLEGQEGSNGGEVFYALVPDPEGSQGPPLSRSVVLTNIPSILAHEFEHMVHFNQRILVGGAGSQDALWLSEALAQMAEDLVGAAWEEHMNPTKAHQYRVGNWGRARRFLQAPSEVSVLASLPPGTLAERGAGWVLLKQLSGQAGQEGLLGRLVRSTRTGVENLTHEVGRGWQSLVGDWVGSMYLDDTTVPVRPELRIPGVDLRKVLSDFDGTFPLVPRSFSGSSSFIYSGSLWSSAPDYFIITPPASGGLALSANGPGGRPPEAAMGLRMLVVRLQ